MNIRLLIVAVFLLPILAGCERVKFDSILNVENDADYATLRYDDRPDASIYICENGWELLWIYDDERNGGYTVHNPKLTPEGYSSQSDYSKWSRRVEVYDLTPKVGEVTIKTAESDYKSDVRKGELGERRPGPDFRITGDLERRQLTNFKTKESTMCIEASIVWYQEMLLSQRANGLI